MDLTIKDISLLFGQPEESILEWIKEGWLPYYKLQDHYCFSRNEIETWMIEQSQRRSSGEKHPFFQFQDFAMTRGKGNQQYCLFRSVHKGDVFHLPGGCSKREVMSQTVQRAASSLGVDSEILLDLLLDREQLMSTALGEGVAVPHTRESLSISSGDKVFITFLEEPIPFGALDHQPVHTLFFIFASDDQKHLQLLARIAHLSRQPEMRSFFSKHPGKQTLLAFLQNWEKNLPETNAS